MADSSMINVFTPKSEDICEEENKLDPTASTLVNEFLNEFFYDQSGICEKSSSTCVSFNKTSSEDKIDARLRYWKNSLEERRQIACKIQQTTCKHDCDILFNKPVTVDNLNTQMVKRVLDYAERLSPAYLFARKRRHIEQDFCTPCDCDELAMTIKETLPKPERIESVYPDFEIVGIPTVVKNELGVRTCCPDKKSAWIKSKELERHIIENAKNIEEVLEFYPNFEKLQVVGNHVRYWPTNNRCSAIEFIKDDILRDTTSSTCDSEMEQNICCSAMKPTQPDYALKVDDIVYEILCPSSGNNPQSVVLDINFECEPYERVEKVILRLENVGTKVLDFEWNRETPKGTQCVRKYLPRDLVFFFDERPFRILSGECQEIKVIFMPQRAHMRLERWRLITDPDFFGLNNGGGIIIALHAKCTPCAKYVKTLCEVENLIESEANLSFVEGTINEVAEATPVIAKEEKPIACPYVRYLNEREVFEAENPGLKCCRYQDLEALKNIFKKIRTNQHPWRWDLNLQCLKEMIFQIENIEDRKKTFEEFIEIVDAMQMSSKCSPIEEDQEFRYNTKFQCVRSVLTVSLDKWEWCVEQLKEMLLNKPENVDLTWNKAFIKNAFKIPQEMNVVRHDPPSEASFLHLQSKVVLKKRNKNFEDALYVTTYSHICDIVEDIVSVIVGADMM